MFSATNYVVAGAIVALFGGLLLIGVIPGPSDDRSPPAAVASASTSAEPVPSSAPTTDPTSAPDTAVRTDLLPGVDLLVKPLRQAGVYEVLDDMAGLERLVFGARTVDIGPDGGVLVGTSEVTRHLLGQADTLAGVDEWSGPDPSADWCATPESKAISFERSSAPRLAAPDGTFWLIGDRSLARWAGDCWKTVAVPLPRPRKGDYISGIVRAHKGSIGLLAVGTDGTLWVGLHVGGWPDHPKDCSNCFAKPRLARRDERGWTTFGPKDGVRWLYGVWGGDPVTMAVDGDGTLWIGGHTPPATGPGIRTDGCGGLLSFDGKRWKPHLSTRCVLDIAVHPNGSIWVTTEETAMGPFERYGYPHRLYVITP